LNTIRKFCALAAVVISLVGAPALAAGAPDLSACSIVTADDAQRFVGGPLDVKEFAKIPVANSSNAYYSICTYIAKGGSFENSVTSPRMIDLTLHFLNSPEEMKNIYGNSLEEYRQMARSPDAPYKNAIITPLGGFGDQAFVLQAVTDPKTGYKSTLIVFYKGAIGGSVAAWKKPEPSLETTKTVLRHILSRLP
jgi:hypothetical protein